MARVLLNETQVARLESVAPLLQRIYDGRHVTMSEYKQLFDGTGGKVYAEVHNQHNKHPYRVRRGGCSSCGGKNLIADAIRLANWYINTKNNK